MSILMPHCRTNTHKYISVNLLNQCKYQLQIMFEYSDIFNLFILSLCRYQSNIKMVDT